MSLLFCFLFLAPGFSLLCPFGTSAASIGLIYIESNTGGASGGHLALKTEDDIFHFQHHEDGFFRLTRHSWHEFKKIYNDLENRPLHLAEALFPESVERTVNQHFTRLLLYQNRNFENLHALERAKDFLKQLYSGNPVELEIDGLGYFQGPDSPTAGEIIKLKKTIAAELGADFLSRSIEREQQRISELLKIAAADPFHVGQGPFQHHDLLPSTTSLTPRLITSVDQLEEALGLLMALELLEVRQELMLSAQNLTLQPQFIHILRKFSDRLAASILNLLQSPRPDKSGDLLLQMARFYAIQKSIEAKKLIVLDPYPDKCPAVAFKTWHEDRPELEKLLHELKRRLESAQELISSRARMDMLDYNKLENLAARYAELATALKQAKAIRLLEHDILPQRTGRYVLNPPKDYKEADRDPLRLTIKLYEQYRQKLHSIYSYDLISKNCVTELVRQARLALSEQEDRIPPNLIAALSPPETAAFIPFAYFDYWCHRLSGVQVSSFPAYRIRRLKQLYAADKNNPFTVYLREFNTATATIYKHHTIDSSFLLFTDDVLLLRPLYGGVNSVYAIVNMAAGAAALPFDKGTRLKEGFWGLVYSLPELFFSNIRKGSFVWTER